jgi:hypothetical protein
MAKFPFMQYVPKEWLSDPQVSQCKPATRGVWWDAISAMHEMDRCGQLSGTLENLARVCRCRVDEMRAAADELRSCGAADVTECNGIVTLVNRRMRREAEERKSVKNRVDKHRAKQKESEAEDACNDSETDLKRSINHNHNHKKNKNTSSRPLPSVEAFQLAEKLRAAIAFRDRNAKAAKTDDLGAWAHDFDLLLRIDGRKPDEIEAVIAWCQSDGCFWGPNILSGRKFREKFDTMWGQLQRDQGEKNATNSGNPKRHPDGSPRFDPNDIPEWAGPPK